MGLNRRFLAITVTAFLVIPANFSTTLGWAQENNPPQETVEHNFESLWREATSSLKAMDYDLAYKQFQELSIIFPDTPQPIHQLAYLIGEGQGTSANPALATDYFKRAFDLYLARNKIDDAQALVQIVGAVIYGNRIAHGDFDWGIDALIRAADQFPIAEESFYNQVGAFYVHAPDDKRQHLPDSLKNLLAELETEANAGDLVAMDLLALLRRGGEGRMYDKSFVESVLFDDSQARSLYEQIIENVVEMPAPTSQQKMQAARAMYSLGVMVDMTQGFPNYRAKVDDSEIALLEKKEGRLKHARSLFVDALNWGDDTAKSWRGGMELQLILLAKSYFAADLDERATDILTDLAATAMEEPFTDWNNVTHNLRQEATDLLNQ